MVIGEQAFFCANYKESIKHIGEEKVVFQILEKFGPTLKIPREEKGASWPWT